MKNLIIIFSVLFTAVSLNSCTSDDFESQVQNSNKTFKKEVDYSLYARGGDTIIEGTNYITEGANDPDPVIVIKKD